MITRSTFELIKHKHGSYASWAVGGAYWSDAEIRHGGSECDAG